MNEAPTTILRFASGSISPAPIVKLLSSVAFAGEIVPEGALLQVDQDMAADLIRRERAVMATVEEIAAATPVESED